MWRLTLRINLIISSLGRTLSSQSPSYFYLTIMDSYIILKNIRFFAQHGVAPQERLVGNEFILNLKLKVDVSLAIETDEVSHTVSYADVYQSVKKEMEISSRLLEHVGGRIIKRLFHDFPTIEEIKLSLMKRNPPMGADIEAAGIELCILCTTY